MNSCTIIGNLGHDPELRYTKSGQAVCNFSVATNERWTDKEGQKQEKTTWFRVVVWGAQGENCEKFLSKGRQVAVRGRIQTDSYEKDGVTHYTWELVAQDVEFLSGGDGVVSGAGQRREPAPAGHQHFDQSYNDDDIPFIFVWAVLPFMELLSHFGGLL